MNHEAVLRRTKPKYSWGFGCPDGAGASA